RPDTGGGEVMQTWRVDAGAQTLVIASDGGVPVAIYWGARLPEDEDLAQIAGAGEADLTGGMLDANPAVSFCPQSSEAFPGQPGLVMAEADGTPLHPRFRFAEAQVSDTGLSLTSVAGSLTLIHTISIEGDTGVIALRSALSADRAVRVQWLAAPVLPSEPARTSRCPKVPLLLPKDRDGKSARRSEASASSRFTSRARAGGMLISTCQRRPT
ncbi:MAG: hypothetical protein B7Z81_07940, partial [Acidocella sp. 20-61-6]